METTVKEIFRNASEFSNKEVTLYGWIRNHRAQKAFGFINFHDGSFFEQLQVVYEEDKLANFSDVQKFRVGSSLMVTGVVVLTPEMKQPFELKA
ncbi:MAG: OB-fold nucleic acid binding domain-containing protein, partial [Acholeplasmataceae bacterium]